MIIQTKKEINGVMYDYAYSDSGFMIERDCVRYSEAVDLWDTEANNPDNAPTIWEDIAYRDGFRVIPQTITAGTAFALDECGWWGDTLYRSTISANVWTPEQYSAGWEAVTE